MLNPPYKPLFVNWDQVAAFRLSRHRLSERASKKSLVSVAGEIGGVQAQLFSAAQIALWARIRDLQSAHIQEALDERLLVKAACMRRTLFLVPAEELAIYVRGSAGRAEKEIRWALGKGVQERVVERAIETVLGVLDEPLTRPEIAERVSRALGVQMQVYHGGGWGNRRQLASVPVGDLNYPVVDLLHLAAARGVACYGPYRGNEPTFVRADAWIPGWKDVPREQAEELLLRRYLHAFGPATVSDFTMWAGITLREAREIWARQQSQFASVNVEGWTAEILREDLNKLARAKFKEPVIRLLPYFDTFLLGHKERDHLVAPEYRPNIYRAQGWIAPAVLVNGRIVGVWEYAQRKERTHIKVVKFESIPQSIAAGIRGEAQDFGRFIGQSQVEVEIR